MKNYQLVTDDIVHMVTNFPPFATQGDQPWILP